MTQRPLYIALASKVVARLNCIKADNIEWRDRHKEDADRLVRDLMPSGSGFDNGTTLDWEHSTAERLYFKTAFHHMDDHGSYDGWTEHTVFVTPSLLHGVKLSITGRNRRDIKDYIHDCFHDALMAQEPQAEEQAA
jgi:hypothetical protein